MSRVDGGYFVQRTMVVRAFADSREVIAFFSGLAVEAHPTIAHELANILNRKAGLPEVKVPKPKQEKLLR